MEKGILKHNRKETMYILTNMFCGLKVEQHGNKSGARMIASNRNKRRDCIDGHPSTMTCHDLSKSLILFHNSSILESKL